MLRILVTAMLAAACAASAAEIHVLSGGAVKSAFTQAAAQWEQKTGHQVKATFAPAGEMQKRLAAGERYDLVIVPEEGFATLEKDGLVAPGSRRPIAGVGIGIAVRKGAPVPDISTPDAVKRLLVETKSLTYMDPTRGTSGKHFDEVVLPKLGVREAVRAKTKLGEGGAIAEKVAHGEVDVAVQQITELLPVEGVTVVGPLPAELQKLTVYAGAVPRAAAAPAEAASLLAFLASAEARPTFAAKGFSAP